MANLALVTGASSGIGKSFAERLSKDGSALVLVARRRERLEQLAQRLGKAEVLVADLASEAGLVAVEQRLARGDVTLLVNNAGVSRYQPFAQFPPDNIDELVRLHVLTTTRLTRAALPPMLERGAGAVINVASLLSLSGTVPPVPMPYRAVYAAAKAYMLAFTQTLSHEVAAKGVKVQALLPGIVETEFHDDMGPAKGHLPPGMQPDDVVQASLSALSRGEIVCIPPLDDGAAFERIGEAQRAVLGSARNTKLAARYSK